MSAPAPSSRPDSRTAREQYETVWNWLGGCYEMHGFREDCISCTHTRDAIAALAALLAEIERLEGERDGQRHDTRVAEHHYERAVARAEAAEALAEQRAVAIRELLDDVGVVFDDPRLSYIEVQISPDALDKLRGALADGGQGTVGWCLRCRQEGRA